MNAGLLFDPLFAEPFLTGAAYALVLPLLGAYLRLRDEWLAALALAQTSAAGCLLAMLINWPTAFGGVLAAVLAAGLKHGFEGAGRSVQGAAYAMLLLLGWGVSMLLVANAPVAERLGHALFDGQLYFTDRMHLVYAVLCLLLGGGGLRSLSRRLLLANFFPDFFRARGMSERHAHFAFDTLVAVVLALATMSIGVMGAFALIFIPALIAFRWATSWRNSLGLAAAIGFVAYVGAFVLALLLDQPFGPLLGLLLVGVAVISVLPGMVWRGRR